VSDTLPAARASSITSLVKKLMCALVECPDDKFTDRVAVINKLLEVWSEGDDVDVRCNEPPQMLTAQLSAADVQMLASSSQNAPGSLLQHLVDYLSLFQRSYSLLTLEGLRDLRYMWNRLAPSVLVRCHRRRLKQSIVIFSVRLWFLET